MSTRSAHATLPSPAAMAKMRLDLCNMVAMGVEDAKVLAYLVQVPGAAKALALQCKGRPMAATSSDSLASFASICMDRSRVDLLRLLIQESARWIDPAPGKAIEAICASWARVPNAPDPEVENLAYLARSKMSLPGLELAIDLGGARRAAGRLHASILGSLNPKGETDDFVLAAVRLLLAKDVSIVHDTMDHVIDFLLLQETQDASPWRRRLKGMPEVCVNPRREILQEILACYLDAGAFEIDAQEVHTGYDGLPHRMSPLFAAVSQGCVVLAEGLINLGASLDTVPEQIDGVLSQLAPEFATAMRGLLATAHMQRAIDLAKKSGLPPSDANMRVSAPRRAGV